MSDTLVPSNVVADKYAVSAQTVYLWRKNGKIPSECYTKIGKTYRYDLAKIQAHFDEQKENPPVTPVQRTLYDLTPEGENDYE